MFTRDDQAQRGRRLQVGTIVLTVVVLGAASAIVLFSLQGQARSQPTLPSGGTVANGPTVPATDPVVAAAEVETAKVESAEGTVLDRLTDDYGAKCFSALDATIARPKDLPERLDKHIEAAGVSEGWLPPDEKDWWFSGTEVLWVGSLDSYAHENRADAIYTDEHSTWLFSPDEKTPSAIEVTSFVSAKGVTVWQRVGGIAPGVLCEASDE